jgi:flagellar motor protein MotB
MGLFNQDAEEEGFDITPVWPVVSDIMAAVSGLFVLLFVWAVVFQIDLASALRAEREARQAEAERLQALERALAEPLAKGRITLEGGRIGIQGNVLFPLGSADLSAEGQGLVAELADPLHAYAEHAGTAIMVSGFTDDLPIHADYRFRDNWELSTERALTVTRALVRDGFPAGRIFAAGFGESMPVAPNDSEANRALNRRVEIAPVPQTTRAPTPLSTPVPSQVPAPSP